jgi:hypothetical protein
MILPYFETNSILIIRILSKITNGSNESLLHVNAIECNHLNLLDIKAVSQQSFYF